MTVFLPTPDVRRPSDSDRRHDPWGKFPWMVFVMEEDVVPRPVLRGLGGARTVVPPLAGETDLFQQAGRLR